MTADFYPVRLTKWKGNLLKDAQKIADERGGPLIVVFSFVQPKLSRRAKAIERELAAYFAAGIDYRNSKCHDPAETSHYHRRMAVGRERAVQQSMRPYDEMAAMFSGYTRPGAVMIEFDDRARIVSVVFSAVPFEKLVRSISFPQSIQQRIAERDAEDRETDRPKSGFFVHAARAMRMILGGLKNRNDDDGR